MTTMLAELYDALKDAGASDEKARRAAEAMANYEGRFDQIDRRFDQVDRRFDAQDAGLDRRFDAVDRKIDSVKAELQVDIAGVKADLTVNKWMLGAVFALLIPVFLRTFTH